MTTPSTSELLGTSLPAFKFEAVGDEITGSITDFRVAQQTSYGDNKPLYWSDGSPRWQIIITVDDAHTLYVRGQMLTALRAALRTAGETDLAVGAKITVTYTGNSDGKPGLNPAKVYTVQYTA